MKSIKLTIKAIYLVTALSIGGSLALAETSTIFCAQDARVCSNGTIVSRNPNNACTFDACPTSASSTSAKGAFMAPLVSVCSMEAKLCSDGKTSVGRTGPNCEFSACPVSSIKPIITDTLKKGDYDSACTTAIDLSNNMRVRSADLNFNGEVTKLQKFLYEKKFLSINPTGYFGSMTKAAVIKFQLSVGLDGTGYVGSYTRAAIKAINICDDENVSDTVY